MTDQAGRLNMSLVKPNRPRFVKVEELAAMVQPGNTFGVGGHHFARLPIALLRAIGQRGVKDLRWMTAQTHAAFMDIVRKGTRIDKGMASFADILSETEANAIHNYLIARANEDWQDEAVPRDAVHGAQ